VPGAGVKAQGVYMKEDIKVKLEEVRSLLKQATMNGNSLESTAVLAVMERNLNKLLEYIDTYLD